MKDLALCTCLQKNEGNPALHALDCKFRLKYDDIVMTIALSEEEVKVLAYVLNMIQHTMTAIANEERPEVLRSLASVQQKCQSGLKELALIRTGQVSVKPSEQKGG